MTPTTAACASAVVAMASQTIAITIIQFDRVDTPITTRTATQGSGSGLVGNCCYIRSWCNCRAFGNAAFHIIVSGRKCQNA